MKIVQIIDKTMEKERIKHCNHVCNYCGYCTDYDNYILKKIWNIVKPMLRRKKLMKKEKWDGKSRPSNDTYRKNFNEIFGKKPEMDLKGTIFCKSKNCNNHLYKNESSSLKGYCLDCG
jgi:poly(A) polymerase Pap1